MPPPPTPGAEATPGSILAGVTAQENRARPTEAFLPWMQRRERSVAAVPENLIKGVLSVGPALSALAGLGARTVVAVNNPEERLAVGRDAFAAVKGAISDLGASLKDPIGTLVKYPFEVAPIVGGIAKLGAQAGVRVAGAAAPPLLRDVAERGLYRAGADAASNTLAERSPDFSRWRDTHRAVSAAEGAVQTARENFYVARNQNYRRFNTLFGSLAPEDHARVTRILAGIDDGADAAPAVKAAADAYRDISTQTLVDWQKAGKLSEETSTARAYQPLRITGLPATETRPAVKALGQEGEMELQKARAWGKPSEREAAVAAIQRKTDQLASELAARGRAAPVYFPFLKDPSKIKLSDFLAQSGIKRYRPKTLKLSTGATFGGGEYVTDLRTLAARSTNDLLKYQQAEATIKGIMESPAIPKRAIKSLAEVGPDETLFAPDGILKLYRLDLDFGRQVGELLGAYGPGMEGSDLAIVGALQKAIAGGDFEATAMGVTHAKLYAVPRQIQPVIQQSFSHAPAWVRLILDKPQDYWRNAVLMRPAYLINNTVGNTAASVLAGAGPVEFIRALQAKYRAKVPPTLTGTGLTALETEPYHLGAAADTRLGQFYTWLEQKPTSPADVRWLTYGLGKVSELINHVNRVTDSYFKAATYLKFADRAAAANRVRGATNDFGRSFDLLSNMDSLTPAQVDQAIASTNQFIYGFNQMKPWERNFARRAVPFYSWMKYQVKMAASLPIDHPGRTSLLQAAVQMGKEAQEQDNAKLPDYLRDKGLIDSGITVTVDGRPLRAFIGSTGFNPAMMGFGPQVGGDVAAVPANVPELVRMAYQQGGPTTKLLFSGMRPGYDVSTGRPLTAPGIIEHDGHFYHAKPGGGIEEAPPPQLSPLDVYGNLPQVQMARRLFNPKAGFTGTPFSLESSSMNANRTRATELLRFFGLSITLVDQSNLGRRPMSGRDALEILKALARQRAAMNQGKP